jgi:peptidoglycan/LPS O-acetylase OafA/YrhL
MSFRQFYLRRVFRLWPVLLAFFGLVGLLNCWWNYAQTPWPKLLGDAPSILLGFYTLRPERTTICYGAMWSLSIEEQFYLVVPVLLYLTHRLARGRAVLAVGLFTFYLAVNAIRFGQTFGPAWGLQAFQDLPGLVQYVVGWRFDFLALGVLLFLLTRERNFLGRLPVLVQKALIRLCVWLPFLVVYLLNRGLATNEPVPWLGTVGFLFASLSFFIAVGLAALNRDLLRGPRLFDRALVYLGSRSYGIYVLHLPIFVLIWYPVAHFAVWIFFEPPIYFALLQAGLFFPFALPVVELVYRLIEQPGIRLGTRVIRAVGSRKESNLAPGVALRSTPGFIRGIEPGVECNGTPGGRAA